MRKIEQKQKIINAARDCIARFGYEKTTMEDIGKKVGLKKNSLYHYFKSKEILFYNVLYQERQNYFEDIKSRISNINNWDEKILSFLKERIRGFFNNKGLFLLLSESFDKIQPILETVNNVFSRKEIMFIKQILRSKINRNEYTISDLKKLAEIIIITSDAIKMKSIRKIDILNISDVNVSDIENKIIEFTKLILKGLR